jgi:tRNA pseudouridine13 synthase
MELGGEYLHFSLYKENKDTMEVLGFLSARLKMKPGSFSFSGTKDRRAVTVQRVSTYRMRAETLANLSKSLYGSMLGDFKYERYNLDLGDLAGNEFLITLRDVTVDDPAFENLDLVHRVSMVKQVVGEAVRNLQQNGFINYFGLQRFGSYEIGTDDVGKKILQGDFKAAVDGILYVKPEVMAEVQLKGNNSTLPRDELARARAIDHFLTTGRSHQALQILPKRFNGERFIMSHLDQRAKENDFVGALLRIPRNLRLMYVHAYQSLVWNMVASERWTRHGKKVVKGDLVLINPKESKNGVTQKQEEIDESGEVIVRPDVLDSAVSHADAFERARALTQEEAESGKYTIYDIVLPTPGFDIEYPDNEIGDFYRDFMASDRGGGLHPGNMRRQQKDFSLSGSYRKFMAAIGKDCSYDIQTYDDDEQQLVETDLEKLCKLDPNHPTGKNNNSGHNGQNGQNKKPQISFKQHGKEIDEKDLTEEALSAAESTKRVEQHNAWKNLPSVLEAEDKATEREAKDTVDAEKSRVKVMTLPSFKETYIQTEPDRFSRTGHRETVLVGAADATADGKEPRAIAAVAVESQVEAKGQSTMEPLTTDPVTGTKRPREESLRPSSTIVPGEAATGVKVQAQAEFPKIAAIIKFQLGSSQYATMALRELMKRGGVTTYKPEFSSTR